jgi:hypothetical protein
MVGTSRDAKISTRTYSPHLLLKRCSMELFYPTRKRARLDWRRQNSLDILVPWRAAQRHGSVGGGRLGLEDYIPEAVTGKLGSMS